MSETTPEDKFIYSEKVQDEITKIITKLGCSSNFSSGLIRETLEDFAWKIHEIVENE